MKDLAGRTPPGTSKVRAQVCPKIRAEGSGCDDQGQGSFVALSRARCVAGCGPAGVRPVFQSSVPSSDAGLSQTTWPAAQLQGKLPPVQGLFPPPSPAWGLAGPGQARGLS